MRDYQKRSCSEARRGEPGHASLTRRLARDSDGSAGVGYALLLVAVLALVLAGAALLGSSAEQALSRVSAEFSAPSAPDRHDSEVRNEGYAREEVDEHVSAGTSLLQVLVVCFMLAGAAVLAIIGWSMVQPSSKRQEDPEPRPPKQPVEEKILQTRLNAKREFLWRKLLNDHDLVLRNRLEVRHVMTDDPVIVDTSMPGKRIGELLCQHRVQHLVVCDKDNRLLGVVKASDHRANPDGRADQVMTPPQASVSPNTTLGAAISMLIEQGVSFLPVVNREVVCGVLTPTDLVLTLHCSLQLWFRVVQTMQTNAEREESLEATTRSIGETAIKLEHRVQRLPAEVKTAIETKSAAALDAELKETIASFSRLMQQLEDARAQIQQHSSQFAELKDPSPDHATGAASREELDRVLGRLLPGGQATGRSLSLILYCAEGYERLRIEQGQGAADEYLRSAAQYIAEHVKPGDHVSRYSDDTLAVILPATNVTDACELGSRLSAACPIMGDGPHLRPRMSIVSARQGESASELLRRAEDALERRSTERESLAAAGSAC